MTRTRRVELRPFPSVVDGRLEARKVLELTVSIDHNVVDGAPAARLGAELRRLIETASPLRVDA